MTPTPRGLLTTIGATALGFGIVIGGVTAIPDVFAQEATPATEAPARTEQEIDFEAQRAQAYASFVVALASELGTDDAAVDAAIRTALKQQVAERETAGDLDAERAAALAAVIDVTEAPLFLGVGGPGGVGGRGGFEERGGFAGRGGEHHGGRGGWDDREPKGGFADGGRVDDETRAAPESTTPPATLPGADYASDLSAPASAAPIASVVII